MNNVTVNESDVMVSVVPDEITVTITDAVGIPPGGTANQVLKKNSGSDYDVSWASDVAGVPYTGATQDVNLGEFGLLTGNIEFDTSPTNAPTGAGSMVWNDTEGTADLMLKGASVNLPIGQKQVVRAVNGTGGNLTRAAYRAVKITGAQGQRLQVNLARADNDANSKDTIGLVGEDISNNQTGFIVTSGTIENINTTGSLQGETWADGDTLYLSGTTSGVITNVKPSAPTHTVILGFVIYAHANNGKIYTKVDNGYELDELHNVNVSTAASGDYLRYNGTLWVDSTIQAADLPTGIDAAKIGTGVVSNTEFGYLDGVTSAIQTQLNGKQGTLTNPVTGTGTSGQVTYFTGTSAVTGSNNLFWDAANNRLGVGTATPAQSLDVRGTAVFGANSFFQLIDTGGGNGRLVTTNIPAFDFGGTLLFRNFAGTTEYARIASTGNVSIGNTNNTYNLDVSGTLRNTTSAYFATSSGGVGIRTTTITSGVVLNVLGISEFRGNVYYGQSSATNSTAFYFNATNDNRGEISFDGANNYFKIASSYGGSGSFRSMVFFTGGAEGLRLDPSGNLGMTQTTFGTSATKTLAVGTGVAPTTSPADAFQMYSADITAGNAAAHFRTEGGAVIKLYQQTTGVAASAFVENSGTAVNDASTFGGYTLKQIVQALQNAGFLA
jgi:hypothetical protein